MKMFDIVQLNFKQLTRDKKNLFFLLLFPAVFMLIFGVAFGSGVETNVDIAIVNHDNASTTNLGNELVDAIKEFNSSENESLFSVHEVSNENQAQKMLENGSVSTILVIPQDFTEDMGNNQSSLGEVVIKGNPISSDYGIGSSVISGIVSEFSKEIIKEVSGQTIPEIELKYEDLNISSSSTFDLYAPGLIIFAILMTITVVATNVAQEEESGMIKRLKLSKMKTSDYVIGNLISWSFVGVIQVIIMLLVAILVGFKWEGGVYTLFLACIVGVVTTFSSVAVALIIVAFSKNAKQASSISPIIAVPLSFISGSFIPLPDCVIANFGGQPIQIYEILPWNQAITAVRQVLTYGQGLNAIFTNLIIILIMGTILLAISIVLFNKKISAQD
ncbi:ABC transporter permease [uncultured Methanobrevibacter sp.]|uniref:ABC transporter permease n=1 Tax=uncultured Methanobrevibacter sp. TaxID=253161 RepID=UPI002634B59F|nr:ABC transporter permease [uncultured Methanobrevibacter sp.]